MKLGRNDPCPCGSGKKYKKCCQEKSEPNPPAPSHSAKGVTPTPTEYDRLVALFNAGHHAELESRTRLLLERYPDAGFAWKILSATLQAQGKDSLHASQKASEFLPDDADVHINLGLVLQELGRMGEAEASYRQALRVNPDYAAAHYNLGNAFTELGRMDEAEASYRQALRIEPDNADAHYNLGNTLTKLGRTNEAAASYRRALQIKPDFANAHYNLGNTSRALGRLDEAVASYRQALRIKPDFAEAHGSLGIVFQELGRLDEAEASYRRALQLKPDDAVTHYNLGFVLQKLGRLYEAEASYRQALQIKPDYAEAHNNLGFIFHAMGQLGEAEASYRRALQIKPDYAEAHSYLGGALNRLGRLAEAEISHQRALELKPDFAEAHNNFGLTLQEQGLFTEAEASYRRAIELKPDLAEAHWNLSMLFLTLGQFQRGWQGYEMRWKRGELERLPETPYPCWLGEEDIAGKKLLIQVEHGLGDAFQMLRYVPLLEQKNIECWIQVPSSLHRLIARSFPYSKVIERPICPEGLDWRIPVMSLPLAMQTFSEQSIPKSVPYLIPDGDRVSFWQKQLASTQSRTVGLAWRGNPKNDNNFNRSVSLTDLLPLIAACESIQFVTLQKNLTDAERTALKACNNTRILDDELTDFAETAAVMCNMDIVISMDSSPAHLAGALGRPTWILLYSGCDWRWMVDRADSPWYPTAKLFRQKSIGNWAEVITSVKTSLAELGFIQHS